MISFPPVVKPTAYDHGQWKEGLDFSQEYNMEFGRRFSKPANEKRTKAMNSPMTVRLTSVFLVGAVLKSTLHLYTPSSLFLTSSRLSLE